MTQNNETDDGNDTGTLTEETTVTKRHRLYSSTGTLTQTSPSSSITPGDSLPTLPFEIVVEILSRLPVKHLIQLQCVCKSWKSLISDPNFAKKHLHESTIHHHVITITVPSFAAIALTTCPLSSFFAELPATATHLEYPLSYRSRKFDIIFGSCHGILCFGFDYCFALMWNPSISKFAILPSLDYPKREGSYTVYGFGYAHFSDTYKVVAVNCYESDSDGNSENRVYKTQVKVLTLGTNVWRMIQNFPYHSPRYESGKFVSGTVNWLASKDSSYTSWVIVSFDLEKESYQELSQPDYGVVTVVTVTLGVLRDCLCILPHSDTFSDVWLMKEYGNKDSWTKLFRVPYMVNDGFCPNIKALYVTEDDQVLLEYHSNLVVYNSIDGIFKTPDIRNINGWMVPEVYQESLISPCY